MTENDVDKKEIEWYNWEDETFVCKECLETFKLTDINGFGLCFHCWCNEMLDLYERNGR